MLRGPSPVPTALARRLAFETLEPRLLLSADVVTLGSDALLATPAPQGAEFRSLEVTGSAAVIVALDPPAARRGVEIAFVDAAVSDAGRLVAMLRESAAAASRDLDIVMIGPDQDGIRAVTAALTGRSGVDAVHIVSHGRDGVVELGGSRLDVDTLAAQAARIKGWGNALAADADLLVYGCNVAASADGRSLIDALARLTGADVAASDDLTGHSALGGDWDLEYRRGEIEHSADPGAMVGDAWRGVLAATLYLGGDSSPPFSDLQTAAPAGTLLNYDSGRDSAAGLVVKKDNATPDQSDDTKHHTWTMLAPSGGIVMANVPVELSVWTAMKDNDPNKDGTITAYLLDLASPTATSGTVIDQATIPLKAWSASFVEETLDFGLVNHTVAAGRYLGVKLVVGNDSDDDLWFAYGAAAYPARLNVGGAAPVAVGDAYAVAEGASLAVGAGAGLLANDSDADGPALSAVLDTGPARGVLALAADGSFVYTPEADFFGIDTFTYHASDGTATSAIVTVTIAVSNVADHAVVVDTAADTADGDTSSIDALLANRGADGRVSLREAMLAANASANAGTPDEIRFDIAGAGIHVIDVLAALPTITDAVIIDAATEPGYAGTPLIELNGAGAGNGADGIRLATTGATVRGLAINRFDRHGIAILGGGNHTIIGNFIGTDAYGNLDLGNGGSGIVVDEAGNNVLGGPNAADANVLAGNAGSGIVISGAASAGNLVRGNLIGTNAVGSAPLGNAEYGIAVVAGASGNVIGGTGAGSRNVLAASGIDGVYVGGGASGTLVQGNHIGTNAAGTGALPNAEDGVWIDGAVDTVVGGTAPGAGNLISGNAWSGVSVTGTSAGTQILGNTIGVNAAGTGALPNQRHGVLLDASGAAVVGGTAVGAGNVIANNVFDGVAVTAGASHTVLGNAIHDNGGLGIDLGDDGASPAGAPQLTVAAASGVVAGSLASTPGTSFRVEFFASPSADGSGYGEGRRFLGFALVTTDSAGNASFVAPVAGFAVGEFVSATATGSASGATSEFSNAVSASTSSAPVIGNLAGDARAYAEGAALTVIDAGTAATVTDVDSGDFGGGALTVSITAGGDAAEDVLAVRNQGTAAGQISVAGTDVRYNFGSGAVVIGSVSGGSGGTPLVVGLNASATPAAVQTLVRNIGYRNTDGAAPTAGPRTVSFVLTDGDGGTSAAALATITVSAVNDAPTAAIGPASYAATEQTDLTLAGTGLSVADVDAGASTATVRLGVVSGALLVAAGTTSPGVVVAGSGSSLVTLTGSVAEINALLAGTGGATVAYRMTSDSPPAADTLTLSINDNGNAGTGGALTAADSATIALTAVNDPPLNVLPGAQTTAEDTPLDFGGAISIADVDAGPGGVRVTLGVTNGTVTLSGSAGLAFSTGDGTADAAMTFTGTVAAVNAALNGLVYTPAPDFNGTASLTLSVGDQGNTGTGPLGGYTVVDSMTIDVTPGNDPPSGADATVTTLRDLPRAFAPADFGFADPDVGDSMGGVRIDTLPTAGVLTLSGVAVAALQVIDIADITAGNLVFTPDAGATGAPYASLSFRVADSWGALAAAAATLTVNVDPPVNNPPEGADRAVATLMNTPRTLTAADFGFTDPDPGDTLGAVRIESLPLVGTLSLGGVPMLFSGAVVTAAQLAAGDLVFTPLPLTSGSPYAAFDYTVADAALLFDATLPHDTLTVNVLFVNSAPAGTDAAVTTGEDTALTITGGHFGFTDADAGDSMSAVRIDAPPLAGTLALSGTAVSAGQVIAVADLAAGRLVFTPSPDASGAPYATLAFSVADSSGAFDAVPNLLTLNVNPVNDAPVATMAAAGYAAVEQTPLALAGTGLAVADVDSAGVTVQLSVVSGALSVGAGATGVTVSGSGGAVVVLTGTVAQVNDLLAGNAGATIEFLHPSNAPPPSVLLRLTVGDGALSDFEQRGIAIAAVNDPPLNTIPGAATTPEDTALALGATWGNQISITDVDGAGGSITVSLGATHGVLTLASVAGLTFSSGDGAADAAMTFTGAQAAVNAALDGLVYAPALHYYGTAFLSITSADAGGASDSDLATIAVTPVNDAPSGSSATIATPEDVPYVFARVDFGFGDVDFGDALGGVRIDAISMPPGAALRLSGVAVGAGQTIAAADIAAGNLVFTPAANANGAGYAVLRFSVQDVGGPAFDPAPKTLIIDVAAVNDAPVITSNGGGPTAAVATAENAAAALVAVTATDVDSAPAGFSYAIAGGADAALFVIDAVTGVLRFGAPPNFEAPLEAGTDGTYDVAVRIFDGDGGFDTQAIAVTVTDVNDAPVAADDAYTVVEDTVLVVGPGGVFANDIEEDGTPLTATLVSGPASGTVTFDADGGFTYTPGANFTGTDSFSYRATDGALVSGVATVTIAVTPENVAPLAADGSVATTAGLSYVFTIADFGYTDQDGDALAFVTVTTLPAAGWLELAGVPVTPNQGIAAADIAAGRLRYVAPPGGDAVTTFSFVVSDGNLTSVAANTITIGIAAVPQPPPTPDAGGGATVDAPAPAPAPASPPGPRSAGGSAAPDGGPQSGGGRAGGSGGDGGSEAPPVQQSAPDAGAAATVAAGVAAPTNAAAGVSSASAANALAQLGPRDATLGGVEVHDGSAHEQEAEAAVKAARAIEAITAPEFHGELDRMREEQAHEATLTTRVAGSVMVVTSGLSVGYVLWLLRGGVLLASLLTSLPAWRLVDPLPVLAHMGGDDEDDDSLQDMVEGGGRRRPDAPGTAQASKEAK